MPTNDNYSTSSERIEAACRGFNAQPQSKSLLLCVAAAMDEAGVGELEAQLTQSETEKAELARVLQQLVEVIDGPPITDATEIDCDVAMSDAHDALARSLSPKEDVPDAPS